MTEGKIHIGRVVANERLCREHLRLSITLPVFGPALPGQFVHLSPAENESAVPP